MTADPSAGTEAAYYTPETVAAACRRLADADGARVVGGGQTLQLLIRQGFVDADAYVDVSTVPSLSGVTVADGTATVGATTTYAELAAHGVSARAAILDDVCSVVADRQVRAVGTVGGAVCHADPALDLLAPLLCLEASVRVRSTDGQRTLPLDQFLVGHLRTALGDDELLEELVFDLPTDDRTGTAYRKHSAVEAGWAAVGVAAVVSLDRERFDDVRVGLTAVADSAIRSPAVEGELTGAPVTEAAVAEASAAVTDDVDPVTDLSGSAEYKRRLAPTVVERTVATAVRRAGGAL